METSAHFIIPLLWLSWLAYWILAARNVKETARSESAGSRITHHIPLIIGAALIAFPNAFGGWLEGDFVSRTAGWQLLAMALIALGLGFSVMARLWLGRNWSGTVTVKADHELIRSGPYAFVRHPIYTGLLLALAGTAFSVGKWRALIGFALIVVAIIRKLTIEERFMIEQFGKSYLDYRAEVPMLLPFLV